MREVILLASLRPSVLLLALLFAAATARAGQADAPAFSVRTLAQASVEADRLADDDANPGNRVAHLARLTGVLELRPDLRLATTHWDARASPRLQLARARTAVDGEDATATAHAAYLNEWLLRATPDDRLAISVGREVLLWGPASLYSPSNPLYANNGRANPYRELDGTNIFKTVYFPADGWSVSYIDNVGAGRLTPPPLTAFARTRLLKVDRTGADSYWSVNLSQSSRTGAALGGSAQWTVSDALVGYVEGSYRRRQSIYRAVSTGADGAPWQFAADPAGAATLALAGASYTLASGPTLTLEYLRNSQGWRRSDFAAAQLATAQAASAIDGPAAGQALRQLGLAAAPGADLLTRNTLLFQYLQQRIASDFDLTLRATRSIEGRSWRLAAIGERRFAKSYSVFAQLVQNTGPAGGEFQRYVRSQAQFGLRAQF